MIRSRILIFIVLLFMLFASFGSMSQMGGGSSYPQTIRAPRGGAATWSTPTAVVSGTDDNAHPSVVPNPAGGFLMAWARTRDMNADGVIDRFDTADVWFAVSTTTQPLVFGSASQITSDISQDQSPVAVQGSSNEIAVIWVSYRSQNMDLWHSSAIDPSVTGTAWWSWSTPNQITDEPGQELNPVCIISSSERWYMAWEAESETCTDLLIAASEDGRSWSVPSKVISSEPATNDCQPSLLEDSAGKIWLTWVAKTEKDSRLALATTDSIETGIWSKPVYLDTIATDTVTHPALFQDTCGVYWLAWCQQETDATSLMVANSTDGQTWGNTQVISSGKELAHPVFIEDNKSISLFWDATVEGTHRILASSYQFSVQEEGNTETDGKVPGVERDQSTTGYGFLSGPMMIIIIVMIVGAGIGASIGLWVYFRRYR